jgi:osmotically-inducible protein OsmY
MQIVNSAAAGLRIIVSVSASALLLAMMFSSAVVMAQNRITSETMHEQSLSAHSAAEHHYNSPAERAEDDLLIVKVKSAVADSGLADEYPLTVDADHGRVTLSGVLGSRQEVQRMLALVSGIEGVKGINNRLTWMKKP